MSEGGVHGRMIAPRGMKRHNHTEAALAKGTDSMSDALQGDEQARVPDVIERFIKQLLVTYKATNLYPLASDIPRDSATDLVRMLQQIQRQRPDLRFSMTRDAIVFDGIRVLPGQRAFEMFAREFYHRDIAEVRFHTGVAAHEVLSFMRALLESPADIAVTGGFEQRLWDLQVDGITVRTLTTRMIDADDLDTLLQADAEAWPPPHGDIDRMLDATHAIPPREQRIIIRFTQDPRLLSRYFAGIAESGRLGRSLTNHLADRVTSLSHLAFGESDDERPALFRSIAESLLALDTGLRRAVLEDRLLPDSRLDDALAGVVRQFELGELCEALVDGMDVDQVARDGLSRAIRNLAALNMQSRQAVFDAAEGAMHTTGVEGSLIASILENAAPTHIRMAARPEVSTGETEDILRLIDLVPLGGEVEDVQLVDLKREAIDGVSDGAILLRVVTLVALEGDGESFGLLMSTVENGLALLLQLGEYADAADAADALVALEKRPDLTDAQRGRVRAALLGMADTDSMREVVMATRLYQPGTVEHEAAHRLLITLGALTITPLLEVLAEESDMALRKNLVTLISAIAAEYVDELGSRINDPRWYFVRNVVSILGSTHSPDALNYLAKVLRHPDARVRRETIRAITGIRSRLAERALIAALADADGNNVVLAARYLGKLGSGAAVAALSEVAHGDGRGNREPGARIEAIEALGRIGTPEAEAVLADLARQRGIVSRNRAREIRSAAGAALAALERARNAEGE